MSTAIPSFENDIKPLFNDRDRGSMLSAFDLWAYDDVSGNGQQHQNHPRHLVSRVVSHEHGYDGCPP